MARYKAIGFFFFLSVACGGESNETLEPDPPIALSAADHLARAAMALRGTRPSLEELEQVRVDPESIPGIVDGYLVADEFGATIRDIENQTLLMRIDAKRGDPIPEEAGSVSWNAWSAAMFEEPLRLIEHIVLQDRPYTDIVTTDQTVVTGFGPMMWTGIVPHIGGLQPDISIQPHVDQRRWAISPSQILGVPVTAMCSVRMGLNPHKTSLPRISHPSGDPVDGREQRVPNRRFGSLTIPA
jgi:hypothetical protein